MSIFSKTYNLSKIAIYKLYLEVEVLGLDIRVNLTIREDRIFRWFFFIANIIINVIIYIYWTDASLLCLHRDKPCGSTAYV